MSKLKHGAQYHLTQIAATPGLVLWLFNWLVIVLFVIYKLAVSTNVAQPYTTASPTTSAGAPPTTAQFIIAGLLALIAWYVIGLGVHFALRMVANKFEDASQTYQLLTVGGMIVSALLLAGAVFVVSHDGAAAAGAIIGGVVGVCSFGLQQLLAKLWKIQLA